MTEPMEMDAPAESVLEAKLAKANALIVSLRSALSRRDAQNLTIFDTGVVQGREIERREIVERLERNAAVLKDNGSPLREAIVRKTLLGVAAILRTAPRPQQQDEEKTG